jgi:hypothetical protein
MYRNKERQEVRTDLQEHAFILHCYLILVLTKFEYSRIWNCM